MTVLSQVNRGKVAKQRVIELLRREAARSAEAAAIDPAKGEPLRARVIVLRARYGGPR